MRKMAKVIKALHDNIKCGPEYECTCCDQLWYRSSVRKCVANKYPKCSEMLLKVEERTLVVTDILLQEPDMTENVEKIITFAPGEGNKPLGIVMDL